MKNRNSIRVIFLIIRILVLQNAVIGGLISLYLTLSGSVASLPSFIFYVLLIFPFQKLKKIAHLELYYRALLGSTILSIFLSSLPIYEDVPYRPFSIFLDSLLLSANVYIVYQYLQYKNASGKKNPIYDHKRPLITVLTLLVSFLLFALQFVLPYINVKNTPNGQQFLSFPSPPGYIETLFSDKALDSKYQLASTNYFSNPKLGCILISRPQPLDDVVELYSQDTHVLTAEYTETTLNKVTVFNSDSTFIEKPMNENTGSKLVFTRDNNGSFIEQDLAADSSNVTSTVIEVLKVDPSLHWSYSDNSNFIPGDGFMIKICEYFEYETRAEGDFSPSRNISVPWSVLLKDSSEEVELIKNNRTTY